MPRRRLPSTCLALLLALALPGLAHAQDRRGRLTPGLVLETGARHASCDVLQFTPDGNELLLAGDDKVVRVWPVGKDSLDYRDGRVLRWPIFREQRGGIFALAQSPDSERFAIGGFGIQTGMLFILDRRTGDVQRILDKNVSVNVTWSIAWSPDGRHIVYGTGAGELFLWDLKGAANAPTRFAGTGGVGSNRVRHLSFLDPTRFVCITEDGAITVRDVNSPRSPAKPAGRFKRGELIFAEVSPDKRWAAAAFQNASGEVRAEILAIELIDLKKLLAEGDSAAGVRQFPIMPKLKGVDRYPASIAFDARSEKIAVGMLEMRHLAPGAESYARVTGGLVHAWSINGGKLSPLTTKGLEVGYRPDTLAFRPGTGDRVWQLAVAGGPNNEVRLWDVRKEAAPLDTVRSPGSNLWSAAFSANGKYLAWKDKHNPYPAGPNDRGTGEWRVFTLEGKARRILARPPADFAPVAPIATYGGWRVKMGGSSFRWHVVGPETDVELSSRTGLYLESINQIPTCYTFLPPPPKSTKPPRLAIGHFWGVSIYELHPGKDKVRLARLLVGHESEVMSVAPSADGKLLVTAGRDQTLACWSLEDWPEQAELGAGFTARGGKLVVRNVSPGSPAWEAGLTDGDEVVMVVSRDRDGKGGFVYDPEKQGLEKHGLVMANRRSVNAEQLLALLAAAQPAREYVFVWRHDGKEQRQLTTVRQRPLWRFFPTRKDAGDNWILWRWRDFYYDTNAAEPDRLVGWQVNPSDFMQKPEFHPLSHFSGAGQRGPKGKLKGFHKPDKVWKFITSTNQQPEKVIFPDIEPPEVSLEIVKPADAGTKQPLVLRALVKPRGEGDEQKLQRVTLWLDDYLFATLTPNAKGEVQEEITFPLASLRNGRNLISLSAYNNEAGRGQRNLVHYYLDKSRGLPTLHALCVGLNDYSKVKYEGVESLKCSEADAEALNDVFNEHKKSGVYADAKSKPLLARQAKKQNILAELEAIAKRAKSDDWVVLFLSGHGLGTTTEAAYEPNSFAYICADADESKPDSLVKATDLIDVLKKIPCRKLILLDACHSGQVVDDPVRALNQDGAHFLIFAACKGSESAMEPDPDKLKDHPSLAGQKHGFFTEGLLDALGRPGAGKRSRSVTGTLVADRVKQKVDELLLKFKVVKDTQTPVFEPGRDDPRLNLELFSRP